jgi:hypothetical protein
MRSRNAYSPASTNQTAFPGGAGCRRATLSAAGPCACPRAGEDGAGAANGADGGHHWRRTWPGGPRTCQAKTCSGRTSSTSTPSPDDGARLFRLRWQDRLDRGRSWGCPEGGGVAPWSRAGPRAPGSPRRLLRRFQLRGGCVPCYSMASFATSAPLSSRHFWPRQGHFA